MQSEYSRVFSAKKPKQTESKSTARLPVGPGHVQTCLTVCILHMHVVRKDAGRPT